MGVAMADLNIYRLCKKKQSAGARADELHFEVRIMRVSK